MNNKNTKKEQSTNSVPLSNVLFSNVFSTMRSIDFLVFFLCYKYNLNNNNEKVRISLRDISAFNYTIQKKVFKSKDKIVESLSKLNNITLANEQIKFTDINNIKIVEDLSIDRELDTIEFSMNILLSKDNLIKKGYFNINIDDYLKLNSKYAKSAYFLAMYYEKKRVNGNPKIYMEDIDNYLGIGNYSTLEKTRKLKKVIAELENKGMLVKSTKNFQNHFKPIKAGVKIVGYEFIYRVNNNKTTENHITKSEPNNKEVNNDTQPVVNVEPTNNKISEPKVNIVSKLKNIGFEDKYNNYLQQYYFGGIGGAYKHIKGIYNKFVVNGDVSENQFIKTIEVIADNKTKFIMGEFNKYNNMEEEDFSWMNLWKDDLEPEVIVEPTKEEITTTRTKEELTTMATTFIEKSGYKDYFNNHKNSKGEKNGKTSIVGAYKDFTSQGYTNDVDFENILIKLAENNTLINKKSFKYEMNKYFVNKEEEIWEDDDFSLEVESYLFDN